MMRLEYQDWELECDVEATLQAYAEIPVSGADECACSYCRNYRLLRDTVFPESVQQFLTKVGVNWRREAEVIHYIREESGLHFYGGWLHFFGEIVKQGTQVQITDQFSISFSQ